MHSLETIKAINSAPARKDPVFKHEVIRQPGGHIILRNAQDSRGQYTAFLAAGKNADRFKARMKKATTRKAKDRVIESYFR